MRGSLVLSLMAFGALASAQWSAFAPHRGSLPLDDGDRWALVSDGSALVCSASSGAVVARLNPFGAAHVASVVALPGDRLLLTSDANPPEAAVITVGSGAVEHRVTMLAGETAQSITPDGAYLLASRSQDKSQVSAFYRLSDGHRQGQRRGMAAFIGSDAFVYGNDFLPEFRGVGVLATNTDRAGSAQKLGDNRVAPLVAVGHFAVLSTKRAGFEYFHNYGLKSVDLTTGKRVFMPDAVEVASLQGGIRVALRNLQGEVSRFDIDGTNKQALPFDGSVFWMTATPSTGLVFADGQQRIDATALSGPTYLHPVPNIPEVAGASRVFLTDGDTYVLRNVADGSVISTHPLSDIADRNRNGFRFDPDRKQVEVTDRNSGKVIVYDFQTLAKIAAFDPAPVLALGTTSNTYYGPRARTPDGGCYFSSYEASSAGIERTFVGKYGADGQLLSTHVYPSTEFVNAMADGTLVLLSHDANQRYTLRLVDFATGNVASSFALGTSQPLSFSTSVFGHRVAVLMHSETGTKFVGIKVVDTEKGSVRAYPQPDRPYGFVRLDPYGNLVYQAQDSELYVRHRSSLRIRPLYGDTIFSAFSADSKKLIARERNGLTTVMPYADPKP